MMETPVRESPALEALVVQAELSLVFLSYPKTRLSQSAYLEM